MGKTIPLTNETFLEKLKTLPNTNEYEFLTTYKNYDTKLKCYHKKCGYEWMITPHHFIAGIRCPKCSGNAKKTTKIFKEETLKKFGTRYEVIGEYKSNNYPIEMKCNKCQNNFITYPVKFLAGRECPYCCDRHNSKGRKLIEEYLKKHKINFQAEKKFNNLYGQSGESQVSYDFYIPDKNLLIEYDGEFHYLNHYRHQRFDEQCKNDIIKDNYCKENNINLIRIPYWYLGKINSTLKKAFTSLNSNGYIYIPKMTSINEEIKF